MNATGLSHQRLVILSLNVLETDHYINNSDYTILLSNLFLPAIYHLTHVLYPLSSGVKMSTFEATVPRGSVSQLSPNTLLSSVSSCNNNNNHSSPI